MSVLPDIRPFATAAKGAQRTVGALRFGACGLAAGLVLWALNSAPLWAADLPPFVQNGEAGFVVSDMSYAGYDQAMSPAACPHGLTQGYANPLDVFVTKPDVPRKEGEKDDAYYRRAYFAAMTDPDIKNLCSNPELGKPDPNYRTVEGRNVPVDGIDLDGRVSTADGAPAPGTCAHDDFTGADGKADVDNQFFRVIGCPHPNQTTGDKTSGLTVSMLTGAWGILIKLSGVDDIHNDDDVTVGIYANADPIQLSATREPLENATYAMDQDPRYRAEAKGRIVDGVLTSDPVDLQLHAALNGMRLERKLRRARVRMTLGEDGILEGYLGAYMPVEDLYDLSYGFRNGKDGSGEPAPLRLKRITGIGKARVLGYTCNGVYYALHANADGDPDPETGKCTSISMQYHIKAIPAFVVDVATESANKDLDKAGYTGKSLGYDKK